MRKVLLAASALALLATPAVAADDVLAGAYGNTLIVSGGMLESHTHYRADKTFDVTATYDGRTIRLAGTADRTSHDRLIDLLVAMKLYAITNEIRVAP